MFLFSDLRCRSFLECTQTCLRFQICSDWFHTLLKINWNQWVTGSLSRKIYMYINIYDIICKFKEALFCPNFSEMWSFPPWLNTLRWEELHSHLRTTCTGERRLYCCQCRHGNAVPPCSTTIVYFWVACWWRSFWKCTLDFSVTVQICDESSHPVLRADHNVTWSMNSHPAQYSSL